jgi:hypothetical protein
MKRVNFIFKLLIFLLLIASIGFIASCEKHPFVEKPHVFSRHLQNFTIQSRR